ncbi:hypothetical protein V6Z12_A08G008800 [Gossypium hirsutum]
MEGLLQAGSSYFYYNFINSIVAEGTILPLRGIRHFLTRDQLLPTDYGRSIPFKEVFEVFFIRS